jgi:hypothetical protein
MNNTINLVTWIVDFLLLWENTWSNQLQREKIILVHGFSP